MKKILAIVFILLMSVSISTTYAIVYETPAGTHLQPTTGGSESSGKRAQGSVVTLDGNNKIVHYKIYCKTDPNPVCFRIVNGGKGLEVPDGVLVEPDEGTTENEGIAVDDVSGS